MCVLLAGFITSGNSSVWSNSFLRLFRSLFSSPDKIIIALLYKRKRYFGIGAWRDRAKQNQAFLLSQMTDVLLDFAREGCTALASFSVDEQCVRFKSRLRSTRMSVFYIYNRESERESERERK